MGELPSKGHFDHEEGVVASTRINQKAYLNWEKNASKHRRNSPWTPNTPPATTRDHSSPWTAVMSHTRAQDHHEQSCRASYNFPDSPLEFRPGANRSRLAGTMG
jgi:hypothetical protein